MRESAIAHTADAIITSASRRVQEARFVSRGPYAITAIATATGTSAVCDTRQP